MEWLYAIVGTLTGGTVIFLTWWLIHIGKTIAKNDELARRLTAGEIVAKKKNQYIKDVDAIAAKSRDLDEKLRDEFKRGPDAASVLRIFRDAASNTTPNSPKDAA